MKQPNIPKVRWIVFAGFLALMWTGLVADLLPEGLVNQIPNQSGEILSLLLFYGMWAVAVWILIRRKGIAPSDIVGRPPSKSAIQRAVAISIPLVIFMLGAIWLLFLPLTFVAPDFVEEWLEDDLTIISSPDGTYPLFANCVLFLALVIVAPLVEEFIFRGLIFQRLAVKWHVSAGMVVSSVLFGLLHPDPTGSIVFALVMCSLFMESRSLAVPIVAHAAINLLAYVGAWLERLWASDPTPSVVADIQEGWWFGALCLAISVPWVAYFFRRHWPSRRSLLPVALAAEARSALRNGAEQAAELDGADYR